MQKGIQIIPVILCGGTGTRLWPLSRKSYPKQFLNLNIKSNKSLLQQTQERLLSLKNIKPPILICNEEHRFIVAEQMRKIGVKPSAIILEKVGRNTGPAISLAALKALELDQNSILLILSSDHLILNNNNFVRSINSAIDLAKKDKLVTFGVLPTSPETGYGYIESKNKLNLKTLKGEVIENFLEKPDKERARKFLSDKKYSWNSGMFVFKANTIICELQKLAPEIYFPCVSALKNAKKDLDFQRLDEKAMKDCPSISIDVAILEKTKLGSVVPLDAKWSDIGSWDSLWENQEKDKEGNLSEGKVLLKDVKNSIFKSEGRLIVGLGVSNLVAVETDDAVLIIDKDKSQEVKNLVTLMKEKGLSEASEHKRGYRPWGSYLAIANGENWLVKLINVNPGASLSLQRHNHRAEHWIVVKGTAEVRVEEKKTILNENQSTFIPLGALHKLSNPKKSNLKIIEVQSGSLLSEDDIERFDDMYGRV